MKLEIMNKLEQQIRENGPSILTGLGVVGLVSTVGLAIKATHDFDKEENKTKEEKYKAILKHYYPTFIFGVGSVACILWANKLNMKRNLALAGALKLSEDKLTKYKNKLFGQTEEKNKEDVKQNVIIFGDGDIDCYDALSGRYFKSNLEEIREAIDNINRMIYGGDNAELGEFYEFLGLETTEICEDMKWFFEDGPIRLSLSSKLTERSKPVLVIDFDIRPTNRKFY
jgi:hypothetical protein